MTSTSFLQLRMRLQELITKDRWYSFNEDGLYTDIAWDIEFEPLTNPNDGLGRTVDLIVTINNEDETVILQVGINNGDGFNGIFEALMDPSTGWAAVGAGLQDPTLNVDSLKTHPAWGMTSDHSPWMNDFLQAIQNPDIRQSICNEIAHLNAVACAKTPDTTTQ